MTLEDIFKAEDEMDEQYEDEEEEGEAAPTKDAEDEEEDEEKSFDSVEVADLLKSLDALDAHTADLAERGASRQEFLEARFHAGTISKSEQQELGLIWAGEQAEPIASEPIRKSLVDDDADAGRLLDISPILDNLVKSVDRFAGDVLSSVHEDGARTRAAVLATADVQKSLGRALVSLTRLVKSQGARIEEVERTPMPRRGISTPSEVVKSRQPGRLAGGGSAEGLRKSDIDNGFGLLVEKAVNAGDDEALDRLSLASARYEQTGRLDRNTIAAIQAVTGNIH